VAGPGNAGDTLNLAYNMNELKSVYAAMGFPAVPVSPAAATEHMFGSDLARSILSYPDSVEVSLPSIMDDGYEFICPKTSALHTQFIHAPAAGEANVGVQGVIASRQNDIGPKALNESKVTYFGAYTQNQHGDSLAIVPSDGANATAGFTNVGLFFIGLGKDTQVSIETIYHLEGTPASYNMDDPLLPVPNSLATAKAAAAHVDEVNAVVGGLPMASKCSDITSRLTGMAQSALGGVSAKVGSALKNAAGTMLGMIPGGGALKAGASMLNSVTGGAAGNALKSVVSGAGSALKRFFHF
jgi:hypothetical protein